jgi:hypothetical protein
MGVRVGAVGMTRRCIGSSFVSDLNEFLGILVLQSCIVIGFDLRLLLIVCVLGIFEDVD